MNTPKSTDDACLLSKLGVAKQEERAYRLLLERGPLAAPELARIFNIPAERARRLLVSIERKGLATCILARQSRYVPAAPDVAIEALILQQKADLERTRTAICLLERQTGHSSQRLKSAQNVVEVISDSAAICQTYQQLQRSARRDVRCLIPAPLIPPGLAGSIQKESLVSPVRYLNVLNWELMQNSAFIEHVRASGAAGVELRGSHCVPFKLMIVDRRIALLPLDNRGSDCPAVLVRHPSFVAGLNNLFEMIWERSTSVDFATGKAVDPGKYMDATSEELDAFIPYLAAGLKDKAIAHELQISLRTVVRRIGTLLKTLNARTRFQAGWLAALRTREQVNLAAGPADPDITADEYPARDRTPLRHAEITADTLARPNHSMKNL